MEEIVGELTGQDRVRALSEESARRFNERRRKQFAGRGVGVTRQARTGGGSVGGTVGVSGVGAGSRGLLGLLSEIGDFGLLPGAAPTSGVGSAIRGREVERRPENVAQELQLRLLREQLAPQGVGATAGKGGGRAGAGTGALNFGNDTRSPFGRSGGALGRELTRESQRRARGLQREQREERLFREQARDREMQRRLIDAEITKNNRDATFKAQQEARKDQALQFAMQLVGGLFSGGKK
jgi:hypothetical protein